MNVDIASRFEKQAAWQRSRAAQPWADKLRTSVAMRSALKFMKKEQPLSPQQRKMIDARARHDIRDSKGQT